MIDTSALDTAVRRFPALLAAARLDCWGLVWRLAGEKLDAIRDEYRHIMLVERR